MVSWYLSLLGVLGSKSLANVESQHMAECLTANRDEEIATLAVYLSSKAADFTNGQDITIDGGVNIVNP